MECAVVRVGIGSGMGIGIEAKIALRIREEVRLKTSFNDDRDYVNWCEMRNKERSNISNWGLLNRRMRTREGP